MKILIEFVKNVHINVQNVLQKINVQFVKMLNTELLHFVIVLMVILIQVKKIVSFVILNVQLVKEPQIIV